MGRTSAPRRHVAALSTANRRWSRQGREVLLGKQDLPKSAPAPLTMPAMSARLTDQALPEKVCGDTVTKFPPKRFPGVPEINHRSTDSH